jgi:hypothetical protein
MLNNLTCDTEQCIWNTLPVIAIKIMKLLLSELKIDANHLYYFSQTFYYFVFNLVCLKFVTNERKKRHETDTIFYCFFWFNDKEKNAAIKKIHTHIYVYAFLWEEQHGTKKVQGAK